MMDVSLHVLSWNGERDLPDLLRSLRALTYPQLAIRFLDNGSIDDSRKHLQEQAPEWLVACNPKNAGFAAGHNQLISYALHRWQGEDLTQKIIVLVNQDMVLDPGCIEEIVKVFEEDSRIAVVQPKIYRAFRAKSEHDEHVFSDLLDTTGLVLRSHWRMEDRGAGVRDEGQFDARRRLVGASGAFVAYRASALRDIAEHGQFFDEDFFSYREDCDIALRFLKKGYLASFAPQARAWHYRGMFGAEKRSFFQRLQDRRGQQSFRNAWSMRNQLFFLVKEWPFQAWPSLPGILFHEGGRILYSFFFEPETRTLLLRALPTFPKMFKKRKEILKNTRISWEELRTYVER
jgi:GT2 family glycosyltransferase